MIEKIYFAVSLRYTTVKTLIFLLLSTIAAFAFDVVWGQIAGGIIPPIAVIVMLYWFWRLDMGQRLAAGMISGVVLDTMGFLPPGTYALIFVCLAFLCEPMKTFFSNTGSRTVIVLNVVILVIVFRLSVFPASSLIRLL